MTMKRLLRQCDPKQLIAGLAIVSVLSIGSACLLYKVYFERSDAPIVLKLGGWLPAARLGKTTISYAEFASSRDTMRTYLKSPLAQKQGIDATLTPELEKASLTRLLNEIAVRELADQKHVSVSDKEVRGSFAEMVAMSSSTIPNVGEYLKQSFNWTEEEYREKIIRPAILEERVAAAMTSDTQMQFVAIQQALTTRMEGPDAQIYVRF